MSCSFYSLPSFYSGFLSKIIFIWYSNYFSMKSMLNSNGVVLRFSGKIYESFGSKFSDAKFSSSTDFFSDSISFFSCVFSSSSMIRLMRSLKQGYLFKYSSLSVPRFPPRLGSSFCYS